MLLLGFWFLEQLWFGASGLASPIGGGGGVAYFAHIGGFVFGLRADQAVRLARSRRRPKACNRRHGLCTEPMRRILVLGAVLAFIAGFAFLTVAAVIEQGFTVASFLSILILALLADRHRRRAAQPSALSRARRLTFREPMSARARHARDEHLAVHDARPEPPPARPRAPAPPAPARDRPGRVRAGRRRRRRRRRGAVQIRRPRLGRRLDGEGAATQRVEDGRRADAARRRACRWPSRRWRSHGIGLPQQDTVHIAFHHPPRAGVLFNLSTGQVLWQRNAFTHLRIASLTKMMTALLTVKSAPPSGHVLVTKAAVASAGSKVGVLPLGKHVRVETMLYGLLLPSGNDAAIALAQHVAGSIARVRHAHERRGGEARHGLHALLLAVGLRRRGQLLLRRRPRRARARGPAAAAPGEDRAHATPPRCRFPIKGGKVYLYNNNPLLIYHYPGAHRPEDRLHRRRRQVPRGDRRTRRRAPRRRRAATRATPARRRASCSTAPSRASTTRRP